MKHIADSVSQAFGNFAVTMNRADAAERIVRNGGDYEVRCVAIKEFYRKAHAEIMADAEGWGIDPYEVDWSSAFTPIEDAIWQEIRQRNLVLYPQYPVGKFFVDFGNPHRKVAIECDGKAFHQDHRRDRARQNGIESLGWRVLRITGRDCLAEEDESSLRESPRQEFMRRVAAVLHRGDAA